MSAHDGTVLAAMCLLFLGVQLVSWGNQIVELLHTSRTAERMLFTLRARTFAHLQRLSLDYYDKEMGGRIMTRMTTDVEALAQLLQQGLLLAMTSIIGCAGVVVILLVLDVRLALVAFVVLPVLAAVTIWFQRASRKSYLRARDAISTVNAEMQESVAGVRVTQSLGRGDNNAERFTDRSVQYRDARLRSMQLMSIYFASSQLLSTFAKALVLWYGARLIGQGTLTSGLLIAFLLYLDQFFSPLQQLSAVFDQWIQARVSLGRLDELLATPTSTPEPVHPVDPGVWVGDVQLEGVRFAYSPEAPEALRGRRPAHHGRRDRGPRRHDGRREVDVRQARGPLLRPHRRPGARRRHRPARRRPARLPPPHRLRAPGAVPLLGHDPLEHRLRPAAASDLEVELAARAVGAHDLVASMPDGLPHVGRRDGALAVGRASASCCAWPGPS